jgi:transcriptional regulator
MYIPPSFRVDERGVLFDFIDRHSFATVISTVEGLPFASHLPLLLDRERGVLQGHMARANPQWQTFDGSAQILAIFHGPHAYISPSWYASSPAVPTWNYAVVHVTGTPHLLDADALADVVARTVRKYESFQPTPWPYDLPADYRDKLLKAIVGFEIPIARLEGKFKLGQNRTTYDRAGMLAHLTAGDADSQALAEFKRHFAEGVP